MEQTTRDKILEIKKSVRLAMNGVVSSLQRKQGLDYKINFGVEIPRLKEIASHTPKERSLALALWNENIRECKMLAIFLMPSSEFTAADAQAWIAEAPFTEIADQLTMHLLRRLDSAATLSLEWIERGEALFPYCGFLTLSHLFRELRPLAADDEQRYLKATADILSGSNGNKVLQNCAYTSLQRYSSIDDNCHKRVTSHSTLQHFFI